MRTGRADLPLHKGRAPAWLFDRMRLLAREMSLAIVEDAGADALLHKLADPYWFQAFGCVLGFDWHSSGVTTTACGALKEGLRGLEHETGIYIAGGKGKTSRKAPLEIAKGAEHAGLDPAPLIRASRLSAKVDSAAVQDGYQVYQHSFLFTAQGSWTVVQQGMNEATGMARRYHWLTPRRFDSDPHTGVTERSPQTLNLVAAESEENRSVATALASEQPSKIRAELTRMRELHLPRRHELRLADLHPERVEKVLLKSYEAQPQSYTELLEVRGVGAKGLRALALVAELTYGAPASVRDPASYAFAHGGKDGTPYAVDRATYDATIESLRRTVTASKLGRGERAAAMKRLQRSGSTSALDRDSSIRG